MPLLWPAADDWFMVGEEPEAPGCMAGEPVEVVPVPEAAGRSVGADGVVEVCARAGAAAKAVTTRQAAICFFSIAYFS
jgi:hypothetical protein